VQTQGSLQESNLASLLQTMQSERATGTLALEHGSNQANLFFLFGHLFHATAGDNQGEGVVIDALQWNDGNFAFDPRAKLPAEETIKASPADLIAQSGQAPVPVAAAAAADAAPTWTEAPAPAATDSWSVPETPVAPVEDPTYTAPWTAPAPDAGWQVPGTDPTAPVAPVETTTWDAPATPDAAPTWTPEPVEPVAAVEAIPAVEPVVPVEAPAASADTWQTPAWNDPAAAQATFSTPSYEPFTAAPAPIPDAVAAAGSIPIPMYPLSSGKALYQGLKSAFVDFAKLLRTLRTDKHTGYVRLTEDGYDGVLLLHDGHLYEALSTETAPILGEPGFLEFRRHMETGNGLLDVVSLDADMVTSLARVFTGTPHNLGLLGRFVNFPALLEYLGEENFTGSVVVAGNTETGVILLQEGKVAGAYTESSRQVTTKTDGVAALAASPGARIEVKTSAGDVFPIDVDGALAKPY
jgi:Domain of unknown function (DUF4388)